jgi:hypothetical protein
MIKTGAEEQMAATDTTLVRLVEVFLPCVMSIDGWTLWGPSTMANSCWGSQR